MAADAASPESRGRERVESAAEGHERGGLPGPVALAATLAASVAAGWLDLRLFDGLGALVSTVFLLGCLAAVVAVRPRGVLLVMLTPPLVLIATVTISVLAFTGQRTDLMATMLAVARPVIVHFPVMAGATVLVLVVGGVRLVRHRQFVRTTGTKSVKSVKS